MTSESDSKAQGKPKAQRERKAYSMGQLRETLQGAIPEIKAKAKEMNSPIRRKAYSIETFMRVCERMAGGETTREALDNEGLAPSTFYQWMEREGPEGEHLRTLFGRARMMLAESAFGEALSQSRALLNESEIDQARVGATRLLVDTLKWYAERLNPRQYAMQRVEPVAQTVNHVTNNLTLDARALDGNQREALRAMITQARDAKTIDG
jgi:hypothetical protein